MSDNSAILALPYIQPSQAQKHVTHNEALARLDVLVQLSVAGFDATTPPVDPGEGETHALGAAPTGAWAGQGDTLATWRDGVWHFIAPLTGWRAWGQTEAELRLWDGTTWGLLVGESDNLDGVGINTTSDATNRLSVSADATLLSHEGDDHQLKINKASAGDTASLLFQSAWTGHAEMGLSGNTDFSIKVSDDGAIWSEALRIDGASGNIGLGVASPVEALHLGGNMLLGNAQAIRWQDTGGAAQSVLRVDGNDNVTIRGAGGTRALEVENNAGNIVFVVKDDGNVGVGTSGPSAKAQVESDSNSVVTRIKALHASFSKTMILAVADRPANASYSFFSAFSDASGANDLEFKLAGDGNGTCDGSWTGGGADYAEYFEWADGNPQAEDRRGIAVVLDGDKIREATPGEAPVGVISGNPSVVGDAAALRWAGKYLRDDFGTYAVDENGERQLNPGFDPALGYTPRAARAEWDMVGLIGKLRLRKGQVTGAGWIKMRDVSDQVEQWLVR